MEKYEKIIQHRNVFDVSIEKPRRGKSRKTYFCVDIASLKHIMRNVKSKNHIGKIV
jgi:hypothetical protein